jgi:hypothetical protein
MARHSSYWFLGQQPNLEEDELSIQQVCEVDLWAFHICSRGLDNGVWLSVVTCSCTNNCMFEHPLDDTTDVELITHKKQDPWDSKD